MNIFKHQQEIAEINGQIQAERGSLEKVIARLRGELLERNDPDAQITHMKLQRLTAFEYWKASIQPEREKRLKLRAFQLQREIENEQTQTK